MQEKYLPTLYQQFIHKSRYARWIENEGRREEWHETVKRYFDFFEKHLKEKYNYDFKERAKLEEGVLNLRVLPSMRGLMTAGPALERDNIALFNCLSGDTLVTTLEYGIVEIKKIAGKSVHVVDGNGEWVLSECKSYGEQKLYRIHFNTSGSGKFYVDATGDHRWFLKDDIEEKTTKTLSSGDRIQTVKFPDRDSIDENKERFKKIDYEKSPGSITIDNVEDLDKIETVYCMEVPTTKSFLLTKNLLTGNCAYLAINRVRAFDELLYILLCGTGVGFSVERKYIEQLPLVSEEFYNTDTTIVVADSKLGWAKSFKELISLLYAGQIPKWDTSKIRPAGSVLKTFGGRASGPEPLIELFEFSCELFKKAKGRKLSSLECHDLICKIASVVVVGGVRRASLISLSDLTDDRMRTAKTGQWWILNKDRALSNNSVVYNEKPDIGIFMKEWLSLYESKSGERGIFNREGVQKKIASLGEDRRNPHRKYGINPCCFTGDMKLLTNNGYVPFEKLLNKDVVHIVNNNGNITEGKVWSSGKKEIVSINFERNLNRNPITCTPDHRFMLVNGTECVAEDLKGKRIMPYVSIKQEFNKDDILAGYILGDGRLNRLNSENHKGIEVYFGKDDADVASLFDKESNMTWYSEKARDIALQYNLPACNIGNRGCPYDYRLLSGLYSANGCVLKCGRITLKSIDRIQLENVKMIMEEYYNIRSYITTNKSKKIKFSNGEYICKESYDLNIATYDSVLSFAENISFVQKYKRDRLKEIILKNAPKVRSVKNEGTAEVYDFTEPETQWAVVEKSIVHNSEIILQDREFCNLTNIIARENDTMEELKKKVELATIIGTFQSTVTEFRYITGEWKKNCDEERLLGVSIDGIMDCVLLNHKGKNLDKTLEELKKVATDTNKKYAKLLGINPSAAITCVKPGGTSSALVDSSSGIHTRFAEYYIRRVRIDKKDPTYFFLKDQGIPCEDDKTNPSYTAVFSFPTKSPKHSVFRNELSAIQQLEFWKKYQDHWCEHKPSVTIYVKEDEWFDVGAWVYKNFDSISGVSFLPFSDHIYQQAPYEEIDKETYEKMSKDFPKSVDWGLMQKYENTDNTIGSQEYACTGDKCEVVDLVQDHP